MTSLPDFYDVIVIPFGFIVPALCALFMIPVESHAPLSPRSWLYGTAMWFVALAAASINPDRWGWAIVWGSMVGFVLLICTWRGFYRLGKRDV